MEQSKRGFIPMTCNTPKCTLVVFDMFRVFCNRNLNVSLIKCETWKRETRKLQDLRIKLQFVQKGAKKS